MIEIYTDGSCIGNPGVGGWAFIIIQENKKELYGSGFENETTNNKMELLSVIKSLEYLKKLNIVDDFISIYTDSMYLKNGITDWIKNWQKNNWKTANKKPVLNKELWVEILSLSKDLKITWNWIKAHNGNKYNEIVDNLARKAALDSKSNPTL